jgi:orotidine 5''-phosphate decarboxylase, subfamily 1
MGKDVIIALDFANKEKTLEFLDLFTEEKPFVKIGMELFYGEGPEIVKEIKRRGHKIFLDLKLHDIPNTVQNAMRNVANLDVDMVNCHAAGTIEMMKAAQLGLQEGSSKTKPILLAVTQLTSTSGERMDEELLIHHPMEEVVAKYAENAKVAGLEGVVCSPLEASIVSDRCGSDFVTVTPGIRFDDTSKGDQVRVTTPSNAKEIGSHYIVVGRPITSAENPVAAYRRCVKEFVG